MGGAAAASTAAAAASGVPPPMRAARSVRLHARALPRRADERGRPGGRVRRVACAERPRAGGCNPRCQRGCSPACRRLQPYALQVRYVAYGEGPEAASGGAVCSVEELSLQASPAALQPCGVPSLSPSVLAACRTSSYCYCRCRSTPR